MSVRVAAVGDLHVRPATAGKFRPDFLRLGERADLLLLAGDLTNGGTLAEADLLRDEVTALPVPVVAVLGNHDHDEDRGDLVAQRLTEAGIRVLDGDAVTLTVAGVRVGVAGLMGGGGGFAEDSPNLSTHSEYEAQRRRRGPVDGKRLRTALASLGEVDVRIALTHFAPVVDTLDGEPSAIFPSLGCHHLGAAVDAGDAHLAVHGHAHLGSEHGATPGGVPVRNVAYPVLGRSYAVYEVTRHDPPTAWTRRHWGGTGAAPTERDRNGDGRGDRQR